MAEEIELKLLLAAADQRRFLSHPLLRGVAGKSDQILDNTYFDTPELALRQRGVALRLRRQGRQRLQTIKLASKASGGLSVRGEWETPYRGRFDFSMIELDELRTWLEQRTLQVAIGPLFRTRFRRITWPFPLADGGTILLALDRGEVIVGERCEAISEVELELAGSRDIAALHRLAATLTQRVPLTPSSVSKAQRGYNLLAEVTPR